MKAVRLLLAALGILALGACSGGSVQAPDFESSLDQLTLSLATGQSATPAQGQTVQLSLQGHYSCQPSVDCPSSNTSAVTSADYTASPANSATISSAGLVTTKAAGTVIITASKNGVTSNSVTLNVTPPVLTSVVVRVPNDDGTPSANPATGASLNLPLGSTLKLKAYGVYSDSSISNLPSDAVVDWTAADTGKLTVSPGSNPNTQADKVTVATPVATGTTTVRAATTLASTATLPDATVTVVVGNAALTGIQVDLDPATASIGTGNTKLFKAIGIFGSGSSATTATLDPSLLNWTSSDTTVATVDATGTATGVYTGAGSSNAFGNTTITATLKNTSGMSNSTATAALLVGNSTVGCTTPFPTTSTVDKAYGGLCGGGLLCNVSDEINIVDADPENYGKMSTLVGLLTLGTMSVTVTAPTGTQFAASTTTPRRVGFIVGNDTGLLAQVDLAAQFTVDVLSGGTVVESTSSTTTPNSPLTVDLLGLRLSGADTALVSMQSHNNFDAIRLTYNPGVLAVIGTRQVYAACSTATSVTP